MPLTTDRTTPERNDGRTFALPVAAATLIYAGALSCRNAAGDAVPGSGVPGLVAQGVAMDHADNSAGSAGDLIVEVRAGQFRFKNSAGGDTITKAHVGDPAFIVDDETVARTDNSGGRSQAGIIDDVDDVGVWVKVGPPAALRRVFLPFSINQTDLLAGTSAELVSPVAGDIDALAVTVQTAVTTGGDVTVKSGATDVDGLTVAVASAATKGTTARDTATAAHASRAVAAGGRIQVVPSAAFDTAGAIAGIVTIVY